MMKMKEFFPLAAVVCALTFFVGCGEEPSAPAEEVAAPAEEVAAPAEEVAPAKAPESPKDVMIKFATALIDGDKATLEACTLEEDREMIMMMAGFMAMAPEEEKAKAREEIMADAAKAEFVIEGDKAYGITDGVKDPQHFAVLIDGEWKVDFPNQQ